MNYKKLFGAGILFCILCTGVFAGTKHASTNSSDTGYSEVMYYDFDLDVENDGGHVYFHWNEFDKDEKIKWWKLVFSQKSSNISYPENDARYLGDAQDLDEAKQWFDAGNYYFRLCAITHENNRYCGDVTKYSFDEEKYEKEYEEKEEMTVCTMEYAPVCGKKDGKYKTYSNNCMREAAGAYKVDSKYCEKNDEPKACTREYVPVCGYKNGEYKTFSNKCMMESEGAIYKYMGKCEQKDDDLDDGLSDETKEKVDERLEAFMKKLEDKGYTDEKIVEVIDLLIKKLNVLAKQAKYKLLANYIIEVLEEYRYEYEDDLDVLDDLLNGF